MLDILISECSDYEFKLNLEERKPKNWLKTVSAFSNGIGGTIFFGINDDGKIEGIENPQYISNKISELVNSRIEPIPNIQIIPFKEDEKTVIALKVLPGTATPYYCHSDGSRETYIRSGSHSIVAPALMLIELILKGKNLHYDSLPTKYLKKDYTFNFFEATFLEQTFSHFTENDYASFNLVTEEGFLTNAGVLFADQNIFKHNKIVCTRWNGLTKASLEEASDDKEYYGSIVNLLYSALRFVQLNTKKKWKKATMHRIDMPDYDELAVREAIVNALIHRKYTVFGAEVCVNIYDDRIEVTSPGSTYSGEVLNGDEIKTLSSSRRNPTLASLFLRMSFMDGRGSGFDKIRNRTNRLFHDNENHVKFYTYLDFFYVVIENANYKVDMENDPQNGTQNGIQCGTQNGIQFSEEQLIDLIRENPKITRKEIAKYFDTSVRTLQRWLNKCDKISYIGLGKSGYWKIND